MWQVKFKHEIITFLRGMHLGMSVLCCWMSFKTKCQLPWLEWFSTYWWFISNLFTNEVKSMYHKVNHFKVNNPVTFRTSTVLYSHQLCLVQNVPSPPEWIPTPRELALFTPPALHSLATSKLRPVSMDVSILGIPCKGRRELCAIWSLAPLP